jgi:hypothetical protein
MHRSSPFFPGHRTIGKRVVKHLLGGYRLIFEWVFQIVALVGDHSLYMCSQSN